MPKHILSMELLVQPAFWAAHMWNVTKGPISSGDADVADSAFGLTADAIEDFYMRQLGNESQSPYFQIALRSGYTVEIEYANEPEDHQVLYRVCQKEWESSIRVGTGGGHWRLPAFRWVELLQIGQAASEGQQNQPLSSARAILLLFPSIWISDDDNLDALRQELQGAWKTLNLVPQSQIAALVEQLIASSQSDVRWQCHESIGWVNDGDNSTRNPASTERLKAEEFSHVRSFFDAIGN
jgi:hypothetical protein